MIITSKQNPAVKELIRLRKRRERDQTGVWLVDGFEELDCALRSGITIHHLYYCPELMAPAQTGRLKQLLASGMPATELARAVFEKAAYREGADGWLAVVPAISSDLSRLKIKKQPLFLVAEAVEKPGNLGAMLRTADAAGVDAVISVAAVTDWGNPNIIRASKGAVFSVPVAGTDPHILLDWLRQHSIAVVAATPDAPTIYTDIDLTKGVAIFVGSEKYGLSDFLLSQADIKVRIPMAGTVNSLNVATSAALFMYETLRQRSG